jgi:hypothetical protein
MESVVASYEEPIIYSSEYPQSHLTAAGVFTRLAGKRGRVMAKPIPPRFVLYRNLEEIRSAATM